MMDIQFSDMKTWNETRFCQLEFGEYTYIYNRVREALKK